MTTPSLRVVRALAWVFGVGTVLLVVGYITQDSWMLLVASLLRILTGTP